MTYALPVVIHDRVAPISKASDSAPTCCTQQAGLERAGCADEARGDYRGIDGLRKIWTMLEQGASVAVVEKQRMSVRDHSGERLQLADPVQAARNLERMLYKDGVEETEFARLARAHSYWCGKMLFEILNEPFAVKP